MRIRNDTIKVFLSLFSKDLAKKLPITVYDGIINLQINKSTCDFCQIFVLHKIYVILHGLPKLSIVHLFMSLFIIPSQSIIGIFYQRFDKGV